LSEIVSLLYLILRLLLSSSSFCLTNDRSCERERLTPKLAINKPTLLSLLLLTLDSFSHREILDKPFLHFSILIQFDEYAIHFGFLGLWIEGDEVEVSCEIDSSG